jgi:hypothetical protein
MEDWTMASVEEFDEMHHAAHVRHERSNRAMLNTFPSPPGDLKGGGFLSPSVQFRTDPGTDLLPHHLVDVRDRLTLNTAATNGMQRTYVSAEAYDRHHEEIDRRLITMRRERDENLERLKEVEQEQRHLEDEMRKLREQIKFWSTQQPIYSTGHSVKAGRFYSSWPIEETVQVDGPAGPPIKFIRQAIHERTKLELERERTNHETTRRVLRSCAVSKLNIRDQVEVEKRRAEVAETDAQRLRGLLQRAESRQDADLQAMDADWRKRP